MTQPSPSHVPDGRREKATANIRGYAHKQRAALPLFAEAYDKRAAELTPARPTATQCTHVDTLLVGWAPDARECRPDDRHCARPADNLSLVPPRPSTPGFDGGCPHYPTQPSPIAGPGLVSMSSDDATRLEGCLSAAQLWLLTGCP